MSRFWKRRDVLAGGVFGGLAAAQTTREVEVRVETVSPRTVRLVEVRF